MKLLGSKSWQSDDEWVFKDWWQGFKLFGKDGTVESAGETGTIKSPDCPPVAIWRKKNSRQWLRTNKTLAEKDWSSEKKEEEYGRYFPRMKIVIGGGAGKEK